MRDGRSTLRRRYKAFRKRLLGYMPFIRRSRHERILARMHRLQEHERKTNEGMGRLFFSPPSLATAARHSLPIPLKDHTADDLCLFVTHLARPVLKPHVIDHIDALIEGGVEVLLIANSDVALDEIQLPPKFGQTLYGCLVRENIGYDFAAWAHAFCLLKAGAVRRRLFLVNDSIVGPLDTQAYIALLNRIRESTADMIGLTANPDPHEHLQSYYLVFTNRLLESTILDSFFRRVVNMPLKQNVIDCYEIWLSRFIEESGFEAQAIFPKLSSNPAPYRNDTLFSWSKLIELGFPFIKSMVLRDPHEGEQARSRVPPKYLE